MHNVQNDTEGEGDYYELDVYKETRAEYYVVLLQVQVYGHHVARIMCDGHAIGPKFFTIIYLTGDHTNMHANTLIVVNIIIAEEEVKTFTDGVAKVGRSKRVSFKATVLQENRTTKVSCNITAKVLFYSYNTSITILYIYFYVSYWKCGNC